MVSRFLPGKLFLEAGWFLVFPREEFPSGFIRITADAESTLRRPIRANDRLHLDVLLVPHGPQQGFAEGPSVMLASMTLAVTESFESVSSALRRTASFAMWARIAKSLYRVVAGLQGE